MARVRQITADDKLNLAGALHTAGFTYRLRVVNKGIRAVIEGDFDREHLAKILNEGGFRFAAGQKFTRFSIDGNQVFVRGVET